MGGSTGGSGNLANLPSSPYGVTNLTAGVNNSNGTGATTNQGVQSNTYTPAQQAAQNALLQQLQSYLSGGSSAPTWMTAPPAAFKAFNDEFNQYAAPGIAAQFGAGSPQEGAQQTMGNEQLAANLYQSGTQNWLNGLGLLGNNAYNAVGQTNNGSTTSTTQSTSESLGASDTAYGTSLLSLLLGNI